jgi:nanoRNase/pAp phosphatase (c-di-AMP/oligoRNAs hydrolase)
VTRSDFDGLACAVLLNELDLIGEIKFVHPKDMQDGKVEISENDITTNLPYVPGVHLAFDHHLSETFRSPGERPNHIIYPDAPSAARVVYEHFGGKNRFPPSFIEMMLAVDKSDSGNFTRQEILDPQDWVLLSYIMDSRTGLGRFREFRVSNYQLMMDLIAYCRHHRIDEILALPDVKERVDLYFEHADKAKEQIRRCTRLYGNLAVFDPRPVGHAEAERRVRRRQVDRQSHLQHQCRRTDAVLRRRRPRKRRHLPDFQRTGRHGPETVDRHHQRRRLRFPPRLPVPLENWRI